jgi:hypothetical protein
VKKKEISPLPGIELQSLSRQARSQLLYRLSYRGLVKDVKFFINSWWLSPAVHRILRELLQFEI